MLFGFFCRWENWKEPEGRREWCTWRQNTSRSCRSCQEKIRVQQIISKHVSQERIDQRKLTNWRKIFTKIVWYPTYLQICSSKGSKQFSLKCQLEHLPICSTRSPSAPSWWRLSCCSRSRPAGCGWWDWSGWSSRWSLCRPALPRTSAGCSLELVRDAYNW